MFGGGGGGGNNPFGGGGQNNPPQSPFGQPAPAFGTSTPFGSAPAPAPAFGSGGFGAASSPSGFGAASTAFGASPFGGGASSSPTSQGFAPASTFGSSTGGSAFGGGGFGSPAPAPAFGGGFGAASSSPFGGGGSSPSQSGFAKASSTFGGSTGGSAFGGGFGGSPAPAPAFGSGSAFGGGGTFGGAAAAPAPSPFGGGGGSAFGNAPAPATSIFGGGSPTTKKGKKKQLSAAANPFAPGGSAPFGGAAAAPAPNPFAPAAPAPARGRTAERGKGRGRGRGASASPDDSGRGRGRGRGKGGTSGASASPEEGRGRGRGRGKGGAKGTQRVYCVKVQPITQDVDDAKLEQLFKGTGCAPQSVRALGTYGYGNYAMRRDADAACQALSGQDLGAGAVYCTVKEKQAPKTQEAPAPAPARTGTGQGADAPAPAQHADKVWTRAPAAPQPRLDTGAASRFVKGQIGGQARRDDKARAATTLRVTKGCPKDEIGLKSVCESFGGVSSVSIEGDVGVVVFKDADGCKLAQEQLHGIDAFMAGTVECSVGAPVPQKKKKAPPKTPNPSLAARNAERFAAPPRRTSRSPPPAPVPAPDGTDLVGTCLQFCPSAEIEERVGFKELDAFEKPEGWESMDNDTLVEACKATALKKYKRSDAGSIQAKPEIVRPVHVLLKAFEHLRDNVIERATGTLEDAMARYLFLWDRFRAIRKDFILQNYTTGGLVGLEAIRVFEGVARYLVGIEKELQSHPEWREGIAHGKQNAESLSETLSALVAFYDAARCKPNASELLENEAEFTQYWLVYFLDQEEGSEAAHMLNRIALERPELYMTEEIQRAASVRKARLDKNWARFFAVVREAPYLVRCLIVAQYADSMRDDALTVLSRSIQRSEPYAARDLAYGLGLSVVDCRRRVVDWGGGIDGNGNVLFQRPASFDEDAFDEHAFADESVEPLFGEESVTTAVRGDPEALARAQTAARERKRVAEERAAAERLQREAEERKRQALAEERRRAAQEAQKREQERAAREAQQKAEAERIERERAEALQKARAEAEREERERVEREAKIAAEKEAKRQAWLKKEQQKLEDERKRREAAEIERRQRLERARREEALRLERERLAELEEEKRDQVRCEKAARHEYSMLFLRFKRRCALRKAARARAKVLAAGLYLKRWRRAAARRRGARKRYFRALGSLEAAPAPVAETAAPTPVLSFASLARAARAAPSLLAEQVARLTRPPLDVRGAFSSSKGRVVLGVVGAVDDPLYEAVLACLEKGLASQKRRRTDAPTVALRKDGVGCCALLVACSLQHGRAAASNASAAAADAGSVPVCVLHDGAVPEPLVDALASETRAAACGGARDPKLVDILRQCLTFLGEASKPPPPPLLLQAPEPVRVPDASQAKRARRALTLAKYANTPEPPPPKRARVNKALSDAKAASDRLDALLRGALAPSPPTYEPLPPPAPAPSPRHHYYTKKIEASAGWKAAKEHDHYAALDEQSDGDSGYDLRDGTHVERHVGSPRS